MMTLYGYFRSSASYRVRIGLNLKQLHYRQIPIHLVREGGEQFSQLYREKNPQALVPLLEDGDTTITQSLAILEYLEEQYPETYPLLPKTHVERARCRQIALLIAADIHPLNNLRVLKYLSKEYECNEQQKNSWYQHWIYQGFDALERLLESDSTGEFCLGDQITVADCCLIPQVYNALRFECNLSSYPIINRIYQKMLSVPAVHAAAPEQQDDAQ